MPDLSTYDPVFQAAGQEWNVDPTLLKAVAAQESGGNPSAVSPKGALGLMQITPDTQKYLGVTDPNDPAQSIYAAAKYLSEGLDKEGSPQGALLYYHGGPGWRQAYGPESAAYVPGVTAHYVALGQQGGGATPVPTAQPPVIVGDSIASSGGLGGSGVVGANPSAVRAQIAANAGKGTYQGQNVVVSSGASNAPGDMTNVDGQLQALQNGGATGISLVGVGPGVEAKNPGTNDALQALATKYGATFVPLPADQMSRDGVHPTAGGYRTLLAAATPRTATGAASAPAAATGPGNAMASDDPLSLLPPAPKPSTGASGTAPADDDDPLSLLPPAPKPTTPVGAGTGSGRISEGPPEADAPSWMMKSAPPQFDANLLPIFPKPQPAGTPILDAARAGAQGAPDASGWAPGGLQLGRYIVNPLLEAGGALFRGGQEAVSQAVGQINPQLGRDVAAMPEAFPTGDYGQTAGPATAAQARNALNRPVTMDDLRAAIGRADQAAAADSPGAPANALNPDQAASTATAQPQQGAAPAGAPAPGAQRGPTFLNNTWIRNAGETGQGYDMGKGGAAMSDAAQQAIDAGQTVEFVTDQGRRAVPIVSVKNGAMYDAQGQQWGGAPVALDGTGREGLRITPSATPASAVPGAQPAGAAVTPPGMATISPQEAAAYRSTAEGSKLLENQRVGEPDRTAYIPDVTPNSVEQEQTVAAARELKSLGVTSPEASNEAKLAAQVNNDARTSYWQDTAGSPVDIQKAEAARAQQAEADLKATWANKTEADAQPVIDTANAIKASPDGRRPAVRSAVDSITSELTDADGNLITDPEQLYGVRKHIDDLLSPAGQRETPLAARATASLQALKDSLDTTIEAAAPGFKDYLKNFSDASKPIDEMNVLHDAEPGLFKGPGSTMRYSDFQRFMKNVVDMRQAQGVNPYKSISDDTMQRLWNLRDDLRRSASAQELARAPGSDTMPNIIDAMKQYGKLGGGMAIDAAVSHMFPGVGPVAMRGIRAMVAPVTAQRVARQQIGRVREMLYPQNPLTPPPVNNPLQP